MKKNLVAAAVLAAFCAVGAQAQTAQPSAERAQSSLNLSPQQKEAFQKADDVFCAKRQQLRDEQRAKREAARAENIQAKRMVLDEKQRAQFDQKVAQREQKRAEKAAQRQAQRQSEGRKKRCSN